jgi:hypothetical protein
MPIEVVGYELQITLDPPQSPGAPRVPFVATVLVQFEPGGQFTTVNLHSNDEFLAMCAVLAVPGRLLFDRDRQTFQKILP